MDSITKTGTENKGKTYCTNCRFIGTEKTVKNKTSIVCTGRIKSGTRKCILIQCPDNYVDTERRALIKPEWCTGGPYPVETEAAV